MDHVQKSYRDYIESPDYQANDGWHKRIWELEELATKSMNKLEFDEFDTSFSGELDELESRAFAAGFHAALCLAVQKVMEVGRCSLT